MKLLDTKEGRLIGINVVDFIVLAIVLFLLFSLGAKVLAKDLTFSGEEMYNAIQTYQRLDSKGFLIEAEVKGKWIADQRDAYAKGIIIETRSGAFALKTPEGREIWVGGSMGYLEDIATSKLFFKPVDNYVVTLYFEPRTFPSYKAFLEHFRGTASKFGADHLLISTDIAFINTSQSTQELFNSFSKLYFIKYSGIVQTSGSEVIFRIKLAELSELEKLQIDDASVAIGKTAVYAGYKNEPKLEEQYRAASLEDLK